MQSEKEGQSKSEIIKDFDWPSALLGMGHLTGHAYPGECQRVFQPQGTGVRHPIRAKARSSAQLPRRYMAARHGTAPVRRRSGRGCSGWHKPTRSTHLAVGRRFATGYGSLIWTKGHGKHQARIALKAADFFAGGREYDSGKFWFEGAHLMFDSVAGSGSHEVYVTKREDKPVRLDLRLINDPFEIRVKTITNRTLFLVEP